MSTPRYSKYQKKKSFEEQLTISDVESKRFIVVVLTQPDSAILIWQYVCIDNCGYLKIQIVGGQSPSHPARWEGEVVGCRNDFAKICQQRCNKSGSLRSLLHFSGGVVATEPGPMAGSKVMRFFWEEGGANLGERSSQNFPNRRGRRGIAHQWFWSWGTDFLVSSLIVYSFTTRIFYWELWHKVCSSKNL